MCCMGRGDVVEISGFGGLHTCRRPSSRIFEGYIRLSRIRLLAVEDGARVATQDRREMDTLLSRFRISTWCMRRMTQVWRPEPMLPPPATGEGNAVYRHRRPARQRLRSGESVCRANWMPRLYIPPVATACDWIAMDILNKRDFPVKLSWALPSSTTMLSS